MKLKNIAKHWRIKVATFTLLNGLLTLPLSTLSPVAPRVIHLNQGDSYSFSQPTLPVSQIDEAGQRLVAVSLGFTGDLFTSGDSLQIDILSSPTSLTPLATRTISNPPWTRPDLAGLESVGQVSAIYSTRVSPESSIQPGRNIRHLWTA